MRAVLIINPVSGDDEPNSAKLPKIQQYLAAAPFALEIRETTEQISAAQLARQALDESCSIILVGGGDGTVGEVAKVLVHQNATMGVLPIGTFNNIARSIGILPDLEAACGVVVAGHTRSLDVGQVNDGAFYLEAAGAGLDATLFPISEEIKEGRWSRILQVIRLTMQYERQRFEITLRTDGKTEQLRRQALLVVAANGPYYGGGFTVAEGARMSDGLLTVSIYRNFSKWELLHHFHSISRGKHRYSPKIETHHAAEVTISARRPVAVHVDGQPAGQTPFTLRAIPAALRVFAPASDKTVGRDSNPPVSLPGDKKPASPAGAKKTPEHG